MKTLCNHANSIANFASFVKYANSAIKINDNKIIIQISFYNWCYNLCIKRILVPNVNLFVVSARVCCKIDKIVII